MPAAGRWFFILTSPVLLLGAVLLFFAYPADVVRGVAGVFSGRQVVQVASGTNTAIAFVAVALAAGGVCWLARAWLPDGLKFGLLAYGPLLLLPAVALLAWGAESALDAMLAARGYGYCTFHVTSTDRGENGTYVYVRASTPDDCAAVKAMFPPHKLVEGHLGAFDLSP